MAGFSPNVGVLTGDSGSGGVAGLAPGPSSGDAAANKFLKADATWSTTPSSSQVSVTDELLNLGLSVTAGSNILTMALKQSDGSTNPSSGTAAVKISMRNPTSATGGYNERSVTASLSQTLTASTTLGMLASQNNFLWIYAIDSDGAGTMKLGASTVKYDEGSVQNIVAESFSATATNASPCVYTATGHGLNNGDCVQITGTPPTGFSTATNYYVVSKAANTFQLSLSVGGTAINSTSTGSSIVIHVCSWRIVSDAVYSSVAVRLLGRATFNLATAGNWTAPSEVSLLKAVSVKESIAASYYTTGGSFITPSVKILIFGTKNYDTHGCYAIGATGGFVAPKAGKYRVSSYLNNASGGNTLAVTNGWDAQIFLNGVIVGQGLVQGNSNSSALNYYVAVHRTLSVSQNDIIQIESISGNTLTLHTTAQLCAFDVEYVGD